MRKLFLAICFSLCFINFSALAATKTVSSMQEAQISSNQNKLELSQELAQEREYYRNMSQEQMLDYLKERLFHVVTNELSSGDGLGGDGAVNVQKSQWQIDKEAQAKKSLFEQIYENALNNIIDTAQPQPAAKMYIDETNIRPSAADNAENMRLFEQQQRQAWLNSNINMIETELPPSQQKTLIPAQEHIPYLFSKIELFPEGLVKITDTIIVVANGNKLKESILRAFPKFVFDREGKRQKVDFNLINVSINGKKVDYKLSERNNFIFMEPSQHLELMPGVYEYQFEYTVDNQTFSYDEFDEFYWNVTGSVWNLVIARAGAVVILPSGTKPLGQTAISGYNGYWRDDTITILQEQDNILGFASQNPLFIGQAMEIIVSFPKGFASNISLSKRLLRFINSYGDIMFAFLGFAAILLSYIISWNFIQKNKNASAKSSLKDPFLLRYLTLGAPDKKILGIFLLELFRKNILDIEKNNQDIILVKKSDHTISLNTYEKKALKALFPDDETILHINSQNMLKFKRAFEFLKQNSNTKFNRLKFKLNVGYLLFSSLMLLLTEIGIALLGYNFLYNFVFLLSATTIFAISINIIQKNFVLRWKNIAFKSISLLFLGLISFLLSAIIHLWTIALLIITIFVIDKCTKLFIKPDALLAPYINEAKNYAVWLEKKHDALILSRDFLNLQETIFALDLEHIYLCSDKNKNIYKLDIISELMEKI